MTEKMSEDMLDRMSEDMPDRMSEDMPDRMSEDIPVKMSEYISDIFRQNARRFAINKTYKCHGGDNSK